MTGSLHDRARLIREKALVRAWEYRQRHHAKGVWRRLQRLLVDAEEAWLIGEEEADGLVAAGRAPQSIGFELVPEKRIFLLDASELETVRGRRRIPVRMSAELLQARSIALIPFAGTVRS